MRNEREKTRLLFVANVSWFFISHRLPLALEAVRRGYEVHVACQIASDTDRQTLTDAGIRIHDITLSRGSSNPIREGTLLLRLIRLYRSVRPDIAHHITIKPVIVGGIAARFVGLKNVVMAIPGLGYAFVANGTLAAARRRAILFLYRLALSPRSRRTIFQNGDDLRLFIDAGILAAEQAILIRGAGVDLQDFHPSAESSGPVVALLASRLLREKGIATFVEAASIVRANGIEVQFWIAGAPDPENPGSIHEDEISAWHESGVVKWLGHRTDMRSLFSQVHIVCLPTYYGEGVPKTLIEAAASGRPIVATDVPGCRDIVSDGASGYLVPPRDPEAVARAITTLALDKALRQSMGAAGRDLAEREYSLALVVRRTFELYDAMLESGKNPAVGT